MGRVVLVLRQNLKRRTVHLFLETRVVGRAIFFFFFLRLDPPTAPDLVLTAMQPTLLSAIFVRDSRPRFRPRFSSAILVRDFRWLLFPIFFSQGATRSHKDFHMRMRFLQFLQYYSITSGWQIFGPDVIGITCSVVFRVSAGGHFGKWPPRPSGGSWPMAPHPNLLILYRSTSVPNLVLLSKSAQYVEIS